MAATSLHEAGTAIRTSIFRRPIWRWMRAAIRTDSPKASSAGAGSPTSRSMSPPRRSSCTREPNSRAPAPGPRARRPLQGLRGLCGVTGFPMLPRLEETSCGSHGHPSTRRCGRPPIAGTRPADRQGRTDALRMATPVARRGAGLGGLRVTAGPSTCGAPGAITCHASEVIDCHASAAIDRFASGTFGGHAAAAGGVEHAVPQLGRIPAACRPSHRRGQPEWHLYRRRA